MSGVEAWSDPVNASFVAVGVTLTLVVRPVGLGRFGSTHGPRSFAVAEAHDEEAERWTTFGAPRGEVPR